MEKLGHEKIVKALYEAAILESQRQKENDSRWVNRRYSCAYIGKELNVTRQRINAVLRSELEALDEDSDEYKLLSLLVPPPRKKTEYEVLLKKTLDGEKPDRNLTPLERQWRKKLRSLIK